MGTALRGMLRPGKSPVSIRPFFGPAFLRWSWGFWRACAPERYRRGLADTLALGIDCFERYDALRAAGVELEPSPRGMVVAATSEQGLAEYAAMLRGRASGRVPASDRASLRAAGTRARAGPRRDGRRSPPRAGGALRAARVADPRVSPTTSAGAVWRCASTPRWWSSGRRVGPFVWGGLARPHA